ncbi:MAG TPA: type IV pilin protein [Thiopseudomonas sp.]|nr:type IV pilin protein [Thiopseudomonas sp.]
MSKITSALNVRRSLGFTLIEMMIVVAVIGIISAIAYPSYQGYVQQARRADAQVALMELTQFMERHYTSKGGYLENGKSDGAPTLPFSSSPKDGGTAAYNLSLAGGTTAHSYSLQAVPVNAMSGDPCGTLTLDHRGRKGSAGSSAKCWKR